MLARALLLLALLVLACAKPEESKASAPTAVKVRQLEKSTAASGSRYSATINAAARVELAFRLGGYVESIAELKGADGQKREVQEGDRVARGTQLAHLRKSDFEEKLAEARAALAEASAARAQVQHDYERSQKLFERDTISKRELEQAKAAAHSAAARVQGALARVAEAQTALNDTALETPIDGVILKKSLEKGALVAPGLPCFSIADTAKVKALFNVADTALERLKVGSEQSVVTEAYRGRTFSGQITRVAPNADAKSHMFEVEVTLPNDDDALKPGMVAALNLQAGGSDAVPLVPLTAVVRSPKDPRGFAVYVVEGNTAKVRDVELGSFVGNAIPVKAGLKEGEQVVVMGATLLSDGMQVQVIP